jgi:hypothetical protein
MMDIPRDPDPSAELDNAIGAELDADATIQGNGDRIAIQGKLGPGTIQGNGDRSTIQGNGDR